MSPSFSFANTREFDTSKTTPGSGATWNLVRRTFSLTYQLPPPVSRLWTECRRKQQQPDALSRLGLGISLDSGRPKVKIGGSRSPGWSSRGGWMWMCVVGWVFVGQFFGWLEWAGNLKHNVYVVLSCMDCVRRYWLPKQDFFGIYLPPHSTYSRDFEPREWVAHTVISSGVLGLFRISKEEDLVGTEGARFGFGTVCHEPRCWTNGSGFFLPLYAAIVSLTQQPGYACFIPSPRMDPSSGIIDTAARWGAIPLTGYRVPPTPWLLSEKSFFLFYFILISVSILRTPYPRLAHWATFSESALGLEMVFPRHCMWVWGGGRMSLEGDDDGRRMEHGLHSRGLLVGARWSYGHDVI